MMGSLIETTKAGMDRALEASIDHAAAVITKNYLDRLEAYEIVKPSEEDVDIDPVQCGSFYRLHRLVLNREESFLEKLKTIVDVVFSIESSLVTIINSDGKDVEYYIGILSKKFGGDRPALRDRRRADAKAFQGALSGNLMGSGLEAVPGEEIAGFPEKLFGAGRERSVSAVSGIVSHREGGSFSVDGYVQGIENLVDSLSGMKYAVMVIADPLTAGEVERVRLGYELLHTQLATFQRSSVTLSENDTDTMSRAVTEGVTSGISRGITLSQSRGSTTGTFRSTSISGGASLGLGIFSVNAGVGRNRGTSQGTSSTTGSSRSVTESSQRNYGRTDTAGVSKTEGNSFQLNYENRTVRALLEKIDRHLERLEECENFGAFECAAYCFAETKEEALAVAGNYNALLRGSESDVQASHINTWYRPEETKRLFRYLESFVHPRFRDVGGNPDAMEKLHVSPASIISGTELAIQVGFPKKSVGGITVVPMAAFGRNPRPVRAGEGIPLGKLYHMGREESGGKQVELDVESLSMHTFITGSTGSGKSTAVCLLLDRLMAREVKGCPGKKIKFLVIEPAKGEYKDRFGACPDVAVYGSNPAKTPLLRLDPFSFPEDTHVLEHIDRLIEIFNVCWPMYAAMPAVLKDAVERAYLAAGWDLNSSVCKYRSLEGRRMYPTFADVLLQIREVVEDSEYSSDSKGDYKGALGTRLRSLTNGIYGQMFTPDEIPSKELFDENVVVDLSRVGSAETKALLMGLLIMKLQEYRMSGAAGTNLPLRHVTVLEEAHHILKRTDASQSMESANVAGKSVEMLSNSIAEMRTYGEGFLIADQAPGMMDLSVIRNTNTKIILRLPDREDRELVGTAAGLEEEQLKELSRLEVFVAAVYQNNWLEPVLCRIDTDFPETKPYRFRGVWNNGEAEWRRYVKLLLLSTGKLSRLDRKYVDSLREGIYRMPVPAGVKTAFLQYLTAKGREEQQRLRCRALYGFFHAEKAFSMSKSREKDETAWYGRFLDVLEPEIGGFTEPEQKNIVASLVFADRELGGSRELFDRIMKLL